MQRLLIRAFVLAIASCVPVWAQLSVTLVSPALNANNVAADASIVIDFDRALAPATLPPATNNVGVFGNITGAIPGTFTLENGDTRLRFTPSRRYAAGELITIGLDHDLQAADATFLRAAGYYARFRVRAVSAPATFTQINDIFLRQIPTVSVRVYGGNATDINRDGFADLVLACEDACDVRVLLNRTDCSGIVQGITFPTNPVACTPSPNEVADFNGDGLTDFVTANGGGTFSILIGNGNGTFQPSVSYGTGSTSVGLAVLDVDGDGDMDVATANNGTNNITLRRNNGNGTFGPAVTLDSGNGEYALTSADMNNDGIFDLVVGARNDGNVNILLGNGNGTFTPVSSTPAGGSVWMIVCGDVNNDGRLDVTCANSGSSNASILLGNGTGGLGAATTYPMAGHTVATDLGDLDGDGDLDWIVSSFGGAEWRHFTNNGAGVFTFTQLFPALSNPSCAVLYDFDNDNDIDVVLTDEIADHATFFRNGTPAGTATCFGDGSSGPCPCGGVGAAGHGCPNSVRPGGALLSVAGQSNPDTAVLCASDMPATATSIFLRYSAVDVPQVFHDGLRCAGGTLVRFGTQGAVNGMASYPGNFNNTLSNVSGTLPGSGLTFWYQVFYRNAAAAFCPPATANGTNLIVITW